MKFYQKHRKLSMWIAAFLFVAAIIVFKEVLVALPSIFKVLGSILSILSPFIVGFIIAFILYGPCGFFENIYSKASKLKFVSKHAKGLSVLTVYILGLAVIVVVLVLVVPWIVSNIITLYNNREFYYDRVVEFIMSKGDADGMLYGIDLNSITELLNPDKYLSDINVEQLTLIANGVYKFGTAIVDTVLAIFSSVYMLLSRKVLIRAAGRFCGLFTTKKRVHSIYNYIKKICQIFYSYIYSALIDALVVSVLCSIAFYIIGVDYALLFGFLMGVANLVPYFGAIVAGVGVSAFAAITDGWIIAIITGAVILVIQQLDANFIQPRIIGRQVGIQPLFTLIAITIGGGVAGIPGIILGVPIAATIHMFITDFMEWRERKTSDKEKDVSESAE